MICVILKKPMYCTYDNFLFGFCEKMSNVNKSLQGMAEHSHQEVHYNLIR